MMQHRRSEPFSPFLWHRPWLRWELCLLALMFTTSIATTRAGAPCFRLGISSNTPNIMRRTRGSFAAYFTRGYISTSPTSSRFPSGCRGKEISRGRDKMCQRMQGMNQESEGTQRLIEQSQRLKRFIEQEHRDHYAKIANGTAAGASGDQTMTPFFEEDREPTEAEKKELVKTYLGFTWEQSDHEVSVSFDVPDNTKGKNIDVVFSERRLRVDVEGLERRPLFEGDLYGTVKPRESIWEIERGKEGTRLVITLVKGLNEKWDLFESGNLESEVNPSPESVIKNLRTYNEALQNNLQDAQSRMSRYGDVLVKNENIVTAAKKALKYQNVTTVAPMALDVVTAVEKLECVLQKITAEREAATNRRPNEHLEISETLGVLLKSLDRFNITKMGTATRQMYQPNSHEVVKWHASENSTQKGEIVEILEDGYLMGNYVLRKAKVEVIGNGSI